MPQVLVSPHTFVRITHADGSVTDLGDVSGRLSLKQRLMLWKLRRRQRKVL